jgi:hypothetical protein
MGDRQALKEETPPQKRGREAPMKLARVIEAEVVRLPQKRSPEGSYDESIASFILEELAQGKTMRAICAADGMPSARTVSRWAADDIHGFADRYERARKMQADAIFDEIIDVTNEKFVDIVEVQAAKLKVDARKWFLAKLHPERFGDKVEITSRTERLSDEQIDAQLFNLLETADHASLLKQPSTQKLLAKPRR